MRHKLTLNEQVVGLRRAIASQRTPVHLRPFLRTRLRELERKLRVERVKGRKRRKLGLLDFLGL